MQDHILCCVSRDEAEIVVRVHAAGFDETVMQEIVDGMARLDWEVFWDMKLVEGQ